jgi:hypothetical protein
MAHQVFISHAGKDVSCAEAVCRALESQGHPCWIAHRDELVGKEWDRAVTDAIQSSQLLVLIFSSHADSSPEVKREIVLAGNNRVPVLPFRIQNVIPKNLSYFLATLHWLDAFTLPLDQHLPQLVQAIRQWLRGQEPPSVSPSGQPVSAQEARARVTTQLALLYNRHAQPDEEVLERLESELRAHGYKIFIDRHLAIGTGWAKEIEYQIRNADAIIPLLSAASVQNEMLTYEVQIAHKAAQQQDGKPRMLPVRINFTDALPVELASILDRLGYFLWEGHRDYPRLITELLHALRNPAVARPPSEPPPVGAIPLDSPLYVVRPADHDFHAAISRHDSIVLIKGARQMGKTSLLARGLQQARAEGCRVVLTDMQMLNLTQLQSAETMYLAMGEMIADQLDLGVFPEQVWRERSGANVNFDRYMRREVLGKLTSPLVWGLDEVDRLFTCEFDTNEVFGLFRSWHNERATNPLTPWGRLTLAIAYATEAHLFITDLNQSPFNVGTRLTLEDFTFEQIADLNSRYGSPLPSESDVARLFRLTGGQPYLVQRALHELVTHNLDFGELVDQADHDEGIFGDHLRRLLVMLVKDEDLCAAMRDILRGRPCLSRGSFHRLRSAGILAGDTVWNARPRCLLYATYLERHLL